MPPPFYLLKISVYYPFHYYIQNYPVVAKSLKTYYTTLQSLKQIPKALFYAKRPKKRLEQGRSAIRS
jgi:hypothetical protein